MGLSLAAATAQSVPTLLVVRNPHTVERLWGNGIEVRGALKMKASPVLIRSIGEIGQFPDVDAIFIATKTTEISSVCAELKPVLAPHSFVISYQNGLEPGREIIQQLGSEKVLRCVLNYGAQFAPDNPAVVELPFNNAPHAIGTLHTEYRPVCENVAAMLTRGGLITKFMEDLERLVWEKGIKNAAFNPVCALVHLDMATVTQSPARPLMERLLTEGLAVAAKYGYTFEADFVTKWLARHAESAHHMPSMVHDVDTGHRTEITQLNTQIIAKGKAVGVSVATHEAIVELIETLDWKIGRGK
jgi:2-dehydropantoate 2-reductase